jgi:tetratricopeptide (TPR) repeat protein
VPLFLEELTSTLLESGVLRETADGYLLDGLLPPLAIPSTLQDSLVARLDRLGSVKDVAQIGAAIGREFSHELIAAVSALAPMYLDAALERLTASGLISRRGMPPDATYSFKHALVQDAAYATLLKSRRRKWHASIARVLIERFPALAESRPEVVARHLTEAGLAGEAIGYWRKAGQLASKRSANRETASFFKQALGVLEVLPESSATLEQAFEIRLELRPVLSQLGEVRRTLDCLLEAAMLAERLSDDRRRGRVAALMANSHTHLGELDEAFATGARALEIAERLGDLRLQIHATIYLEPPLYVRGDYERVIELATGYLSALPAAWLDEDHGLVAPPSVWHRSWLTMSLAELGSFREAAEYEAEAIRLAERTHQPFTVGLAHLAASSLHLLKGDWATARSRIERAIAVYRVGPVLLYLPWAVASSALALAQLGDAGEALNRLREGEQLVEGLVAREMIYTQSPACHWLGRASLLLGRLDEARRLGDRALETVPCESGFAAHALHLLGDIAAYPDQLDAERGETHYRQALALAERLGMRPLVAHCHLGLGKVYLRTSKRDKARDHLTAATTMYRDMDMSFWLEQAEAAVCTENLSSGVVVVKSAVRFQL